MYLLGISAFYHDSAAAIIQDGRIVAAASEERFTRIKQDAGFPRQAVQYCLRAANLQNINEVDAVVFYEDTHLKFDRIVRSYGREFPRSLGTFLRAMTLWMTQKLDIEREIVHFLGYQGQFLYVPHHLSHAASAFYPSKLKEAAILTIDGVGEWSTTSIGFGQENRIQLRKEIRFPHSLGMLYSAFTQFAGFRVNSGEYKLMGLAPYGRPIYVQKILENLIDVKEDGSYQLRLKYFDFHHGHSTINSKFEKLFGAKARLPEEKLRTIDHDLGASIQVVFNQIILKLARTAKRLSGSQNLVIAGGVGLNCVANGYVAAQGIFKKVWAQPAAGDAGGALGAALYAYYDLLKRPRFEGVTDQGASLFGPSYSNDEIVYSLKQFGIHYQEFAQQEALHDQIANDLIAEKVIGLFQGRMEFGPRALGSRSIIGDPRSEKMQKTMNLMIKYRESFRPFAPAVLRGQAQEIFKIDYHSPYMQFVVPLREDQRIPMRHNLDGLEKLYQKRSNWPAITHVDYSARVQLVDKEENPLFYAILARFYEKTGCPLVINTSFNVRDEPIVCTPLDALRCFFSSEIDMLVLNQFVIQKKGQDISCVGHIYQEPEHLQVH